MTPPMISSPKQSSYFSQHLAKGNILRPVGWRPGRQKGAQNKIPASIKAGILAVYERLDGAEGLLAWAMDNPDSFYGQILPKVLPVEREEQVDAQRQRITVILNQQPVSGVRPVVQNPTAVPVQENPESVQAAEGGLHRQMGVAEREPQA